jgi:hypothetical protein
MIESAGFDADKDFVRAGTRFRSILILKDVRGAVLMKHNCFHEPSDPSCRFRKVAFGWKSVQKAARIDSEGTAP